MRRRCHLAAAGRVIAANAGYLFDQRRSFGHRREAHQRGPFASRCGADLQGAGALGSTHCRNQRYSQTSLGNEGRTAGASGGAFLSGVGAGFRRAPGGPRCAGLGSHNARHDYGRRLLRHREALQAAEGVSRQRARVVRTRAVGGDAQAKRSCV